MTSPAEASQLARVSRIGTAFQRVGAALESERATMTQISQTEMGLEVGFAPLVGIWQQAIAQQRAGASCLQVVGYPWRHAAGTYKAPLKLRSCKE